MKTYSILIADEVHESLFEMLTSLGHRYDYLPTISRNDLLLKIDQYEGLVIRSKTKVDKELLDKATRLQFIARAGAGLDTIDLDYAKLKNTAVFHAALGNADAVGEHALGMLLSIMRFIPKSFQDLKERKWLREENRGEEIAGKTVGVIGFGNMGKAFSRRVAAMGAKVLAYDKYLQNYSTEYAQEATLEDLFNQADVISLHIPLTSETKKMCDEKFFSSFSKNIYFLNASRGKVVDYQALIQALNSGKIKGAGLDVFQNENFETFTQEEEQMFEDLLSRPNVVLTPHVAGWTFESYVKINQVLVDQIELFSKK